MPAAAAQPVVPPPRPWPRVQPGKGRNAPCHGVGPYASEPSAAYRKASHAPLRDISSATRIGQGTCDKLSDTRITADLPCGRRQAGAPGGDRALSTRTAAALLQRALQRAFQPFLQAVPARKDAGQAAGARPHGESQVRDRFSPWMYPTRWQAEQAGGRTDNVWRHRSMRAAAHAWSREGSANTSEEKRPSSSRKRRIPLPPLTLCIGAAADAPGQELDTTGAERSGAGSNAIKLAAVAGSADELWWERPPIAFCIRATCKSAVIKAATSRRSAGRNVAVRVARRKGRSWEPTALLGTG